MKTVLITGACGGMGKAICNRMQKEEYQVYGLDYRKGGLSPEIHFISCNVTDAGSVEAAFEQVKSSAGSIDAIIHTAGIYDLDSLYVYHKNNAANHQFTVEIDNKPFSSVIDGHVSISGYNFHFCFIGTPQIIAADGEIAGAYCEKLFEAAPKTEETFSDKLFSLYGATPEWYIVNMLKI